MGSYEVKLIFDGSRTETAFRTARKNGDDSEKAIIAFKFIFLAAFKKCIKVIPVYYEYLYIEQPAPSG